MIVSHVVLQTDHTGILTAQSLECLSSSQLILIGGGTCSGKTKLASTLGVSLNGLVINGDNWALPEDLIRANLGHLDLESPAAYDLAGLAHCIESLLNKRTCSAPRYDFRTDSVLSSVTLGMGNKKVIIVEFIHALSRAILDPLLVFRPATVFVSSDPCLCLLRRIDRDVRFRGKTLERALVDLTRIYEQPFINATYTGFAQYLVRSEGTKTEWLYLIQSFRSHGTIQISDYATEVLILANRCVEDYLYSGVRKTF